MSRLSMCCTSFLLCRKIATGTADECHDLLRRRSLKVVPAAASRCRSCTLQTPIASSTSDGVLKRTTVKLLYGNFKAGLDTVDEACVPRIIDVTTKGTAFYKSEQQRQRKWCKQNSILAAKARLFRLRTPRKEKTALARRVEGYEEMLEASRDLSKCYMHVDMDMFYAAMEEQRDPALRLVPFAVGSYAMLATSNYIARRYGVCSGMPGFITKKLCPQLRIVPPDFGTYRDIAEDLRRLARRYNPHYTTIGLDELTLDLTQYLMRHPGVSGSQVCEAFRRAVHRRTGLTCSGGVAPTAVLSKIANNKNKPNGQHTIDLSTRHDVLDYFRDVHVRDMPGIGLAQEIMLRSLGITTCKDILKRKLLLCHLFKEKTFLFYLSIGLGLSKTHGERALSQTPIRARRRSVGREVTLYKRLHTAEELREKLLEVATRVHHLLLHARLLAKTVTLHVKDHAFIARSFTATLPMETDDLKVFLRTLEEMAAPCLSHFASYRLVGVRLSQLSERSAAKSTRVMVAAPPKLPRKT